MAINTYYYEQLNKVQKQVYHALYTGLSEIAPSIMVPMVSGRELADIYFLVRMDHPEIFYSVKFSWRYYRDADHVEVLPEYLFAKAKVIEHKNAMQSRITKLGRQIKELKTEEEKLLYIHDFMVENVRYDKLKKPYSHEIIGALGNGVAVCEGIAKAVKALCDEAGIWCIVVLSENNPQKQIRYRHAWNLLKLKGTYYHLDATFDNSISRNTCLRHDYFLLGDRQIARDHEPSIYRLPQAPDEEHSYYRQKKLSFTKIEDVKKRSAQAARKGKPLLFHWRGGYLTPALLTEFMQIFREEAAARAKACRVSVNWAQSVIYAEFNTEVPKQEDYCLETVNEGELYSEGEEESCAR